MCKDKILFFFATIVIPPPSVAPLNLENEGYFSPDSQQDALKEVLYSVKPGYDEDKLTNFYLY